MTHVIRYGAAVAVIIGMTTVALAQSVNIVPGQGIGALQIGEDLDAVISSLGPLNSQTDLPGGTIRGYFWPLRRIEVFADRASNKVAGLAVIYDETYRTEKGVAAGSEMSTIRTAYGQEETVDSHEDDDTLVYDKLGVAFVVDKNGALGGRVSVIFVFNQGHYRDIFRAP